MAAQLDIEGRPSPYPTAEAAPLRRRPAAGPAPIPDDDPLPGQIDIHDAISTTPEGGQQ